MFTIFRNSSQEQYRNVMTGGDSNKTPLDCSLVRVIVDSRDARRDRMVPRYVAKAYYNEGKLVWDETNKTYSAPINGVCPTFLLNWPQHG